MINIHRMQYDYRIVYDGGKLGGIHRWQNFGRMVESRQEIVSLPSIQTSVGNPKYTYQDVIPVGFREF